MRTYANKSGTATFEDGTQIMFFGNDAREYIKDAERAVLSAGKPTDSEVYEALLNLAAKKVSDLKKTTQ